MKKIIDSKGRLFEKINIIDLLIVIAVIVLALSATIKFDQSVETMKSDKTLEYTVEIHQVRQQTVDALNKKLDGLIEYESEKTLGDIIDIEVSKADELVRLSDGTYKKIQLEDKYDLELLIKVKGTETEDNYYTMDGKALITGDSVSIYNDYVLCGGRITKVEVVSE